MKILSVYFIVAVDENDDTELPKQVSNKNWSESLLINESGLGYLVTSSLAYVSKSILFISYLLSWFLISPFNNYPPVLYLSITSGFINQYITVHRLSIISL